MLIWISIVKMTLLMDISIQEDFLGQRLNLTVASGKIVTASTDTAYATSYFNNLSSRTGDELK